jgi:hypothetical protein
VLRREETPIQAHTNRTRAVLIPGDRRNPGCGNKVSDRSVVAEHRYATTWRPCRSEFRSGRTQRLPAVELVGAVASFSLDLLVQQFEGLGFGESVTLGMG